MKWMHSSRQDPLWALTNASGVQTCHFGHLTRRDNTQIRNTHQSWGRNWEILACCCSHLLIFTALDLMMSHWKTGQGSCQFSGRLQHNWKNSWRQMAQWFSPEWQPWRPQECKNLQIWAFMTASLNPEATSALRQLSFLVQPLMIIHTG